MPFGDAFKLPAGFQPPISAASPMEGLGFGQKLNYMTKFRGPSLMALGAGVMAGNTPAGFAAMSKQNADYDERDAAAAEITKTRAMTKAYLIAQGFTPEQAEQAAQSDKVLGHIFNLEEEKVRYANQSRTKSFGTPQYYEVTDPKTGEKVTKMGVLDNSGEFHEVQIPDGGEIVNPWDTAGRKEDYKTRAKADAENDNELLSQRSKLPNLITNVQHLKTLADQATYTLAGQGANWVKTQLGGAPTEGAVARSAYQAKVKVMILPLLRDTFGAQFTEREGASLIATLGDPDTSPQEKQVALEEFIAQKKQSINDAERRAGQPVTDFGPDTLPTVGAPPPGSNPPAKVTPDRDALLKKWGGG